MTVTTAIRQIDRYGENFSDFQQRAAGHDLPWLQHLRENAFELFYAAGFPTTHDEDWRFTNVSAIVHTRFLLPRERQVPLAASTLDPWRMEESATELVFVDGRFAPKLSVFRSPQPNVLVCGLKQAIAERPDDLEPHLGHYLDIRRDPFCALNTAFAEDGAYVQIGWGAVLKQPIHLLFVLTAGNEPSIVHPRNLLLFEDESQASVIEEYVSLGSGMAFCNSVTELIAGENATVSHYMIEREHPQAFNISTLRIHQNRSSNVASHSLLLGGGLVRNNVHPVLAGEGGECLINGLFIGNDRQHLDNYMYVEHASPHSNSRQFYNGILDGSAHGVFHGRILVHKNAQKTDAKQTNRNLLLSDDAQINTKPQLEIYADDVKCTHGATIGQIEEEALFYLRSRGIEEISARRILLLAFAGECLERMPTGAARAHAERLVHECLLSVADQSSNGGGADQGQAETEIHWEEVG